MDFTDLTHQAEHIRTAAEQREADVCVCVRARRVSRSAVPLVRRANRRPRRTFQRGPAGLRAGRTFRTERASSYWKVPAGRLLASAGSFPTDRHRGARSRRDRERSPSSEVGLAG